MTIRTIDKLKRTRMLLKQEQDRMKEAREKIMGCRASDLIWLKGRYTGLIMDLNIRINALDQEITNEEAAERIREARNGNYKTGNADRLPADLPGGYEEIRDGIIRRAECKAGA